MASAHAAGYIEREVTSDDRRDIRQPQAHDRPAVRQREAAIEVAPGTVLSGRLTAPVTARRLGVVAVASVSRDPLLTRYNRLATSALGDVGLVALLFDSLTSGEKGSRVPPTDRLTIAVRLLAATKYLRAQPETADLALGYMTTRAGAAGAMSAAADHPRDVSALVLLGAHPDLLEVELEQVTAPVLLIVGGTAADVECVREVRNRLWCRNELAIVPGSHKLTEGDPRPFRRALKLTTSWFATHLDRSTSPECERTA
jgi:putative phosphoribosyl transferase